MKKILISCVALALIIGSFLALSFFDFSDIDGTISIILKDEIGDTISSKEYEFTNEDTLFNILEENYEVGCANSSFQLSDVCEKPIPFLFLEYLLRINLGYLKNRF